MKKIYTIVALCFIFSLFIYHLTDAGIVKWIRVGKFQTKIIDSGDQGEQSGKDWGYHYYDDFRRRHIEHAGWYLGCRDWTDQYDKYFPVMVTGDGSEGGIDESLVSMPVPDENGITIHRYMRYQPPTIIVDGIPLDTPFPIDEAEEVNPDKIPGTADIMVESWINTSMGVTINQKALAWSQANHDDYIIFDWTFTNTGNVDLDDEIELPEQTLKDVYFQRLINFYCASQRRPWYSCYGEYPTDSLRMMYQYSQRTRGSTDDNFGYPRGERGGFLRDAGYIGEATLHVDKSVDDHSDDPSQPHMTGVQTAELLWMNNEPGKMSEDQWALMYQTMQFGFLPFDGTPYMEGTYPGTHHGTRMDLQDFIYVLDFPWWNWKANNYSASGPYTMKPGESFRIVNAHVMGSISPEKGMEVGNAWLNGTCTWDGPDDLAEYYPVFGRYPDIAPTANDQAKDRWVCTGKDSLFMNAWAAQWNVRNDYNVPTAPLPPSIDVKSLPDRIRIEWDGTESEKASDFAGYRVYRAIGYPGSNYYSIVEGELLGSWHSIFECGKGTANAITHSYEDDTAKRGEACYYYVTAFDDGVGNITDAHGRKESLESGMYLNQTSHPAYLTRSAGTLSSVRVVPNPFNINAEVLQFTGEPDKIMFMDIPGYCTIKIYSESGDLVKTLYHTDGSGDESWGRLAEEHSATDTGQLVVSGIYIAVIEETDADGTPTGNSTAVKFVIVR